MFSKIYYFCRNIGLFTGMTKSCHYDTNHLLSSGMKIPESALCGVRDEEGELVLVECRRLESNKKDTQRQFWLSLDGS